MFMCTCLLFDHTQRDEWMSAPPELFPTISRKDLIDKKNKEKEELARQKEEFNKVTVPFYWLLGRVIEKHEHCCFITLFYETSIFNRTF